MSETNQKKVKPVAQLLGQDSNAFNLIGIASRALEKAGQKKEAKELKSRVFDCGSYGEVLTLIMEYCEVE